MFTKKGNLLNALFKKWFQKLLLITYQTYQMHFRKRYWLITYQTCNRFIVIIIAIIIIITIIIIIIIIYYYYCYYPGKKKAKPKHKLCVDNDMLGENSNLDWTKIPEKFQVEWYWYGWYLILKKYLWRSPV